MIEGEEIEMYLVESRRPTNDLYNDHFTAELIAKSCLAHYKSGEHISIKKVKVKVVSSEDFKQFTRE